MPASQYRISNITSVLLIIMLSFSFHNVRAADSYDSIMRIFYQLNDNSISMPPREKVYLHLDNTSYYKGDKIWFKAYVTNDRQFKPSDLSRTLYVDLLNPGGKVVDRRILRIVDGKCHGELNIGQLPFYSGFYEIRAYTRYMLENEGEESIYSRVIPVFDAPAKAGDYSSASILSYGNGPYDYNRPKPVKNNEINFRMYPEGGHLVDGLASMIACEATDKEGRPINVSATIINKGTKAVIDTFKTAHNGRTVFEYTPDGLQNIVEVRYDNRTYRFDMPQSEKTGVVMTVDNLSEPDSIAVRIKKSNDIHRDLFGIAITCRGIQYAGYVIDFTHDDEVNLKIDPTLLPTGIINITLFDSDGRELADRLIFNNRHDFINIAVSSDPSQLEPYGPVEMFFSMTSPGGTPYTTPFSLSIADATDHVKHNSGILSDLLLASEIKGYVDNPDYYFEDDSLERRSALDCLLMLQGWKRYSWDYLTRPKYTTDYMLPEKGIEVRGKVVSFVRSIPKPDVTVSVVIMHKPDNESDSIINLYDILETDSLGRFAFSADIDGEWNLILSVTENGKKKDHRILLDRSILPDPRKYELSEMIINFDKTVSPVSFEDFSITTQLPDYDDSIFTDMGRSVILDEVVVTSKKISKAREIYNNRAGSVAYYDVKDEQDKILDNNIVIGQSFNDLLLNMNPNFSKHFSNNHEQLLYKGRKPLIVIDYEPNYDTELDSLKHTNLYLESIKSIYINENPSTMVKYANPATYTSFNIDGTYGCVVFIETDPNKPAPPAKGTRRTVIDGYSKVEDFYSPDYSYEPKEDDYRRTIYWNPEVVPDENGIAKVKFFNNSTSTNFIITAETISPEGLIGTYRP